MTTDIPATASGVGIVEDNGRTGIISDDDLELVAAGAGNWTGALLKNDGQLVDRRAGRIGQEGIKSNRVARCAEQRKSACDLATDGESTAGIDRAEQEEIEFITVDLAGIDRWKWLIPLQLHIEIARKTAGDRYLLIWILRSLSEIERGHSRLGTARSDRQLGR